MTWTEITDTLRQTAEQHGGRAFIRDNVVVLSSNGEGESIVVRDLAPDGVLIETGWSIKIAADAGKYAAARPYFLEIVEAIMDGNAEEWAIVNPGDRTWTDTTVNIWYPTGRTGATTADAPDQRPRYTRRLVRWQPRPAT